MSLTFRNSNLEIVAVIKTSSITEARYYISSGS
jgi:hypothetical protein